jgi:YidC/Oxa1 family membrane protein insertase
MLVAANIFQPLITVFEAVLKFFHNSLGAGWGLSIVLLTVLIRMILIPLTLKQFKSMRALQTLQPQLKELQSKYKDDKQRQQQELMKFYKENNVNPLGSCLPLVAQLPVFVSLFYMLREDLRDNICPGVQAAYRAAKHLGHSATVACTQGPGGAHAPGASHAGFLFITDLTNKASGATLVVLILLYVGTQLVSTIMMSSPTMDQTQRRLMMFMPLIFVIFIVKFPAGVIVYWVTTNSWTIAQQYVVRRRLGPVTPPAPATAGGPSIGGGPSGRSGGSGPSGGGGGGGQGPTGNGSNGSGSGGLGGLLRGRKQEEVAVTAPVRTAPPPKPPRKKKKRSGRRR